VGGKARTAWGVRAVTGTSSGTLAIGNHTHGGTSSLRYKKDITEYVVDDPKKILKLKLKQFKYKAKHRDMHESFGREYLQGYIAEEAQEMGISEILTYDHHGDVEGIRYDIVGVLVLELVKQQQNEIDSLKEEIQRLKERK
jgi:hypothetical protein